jgi:hypothetical protein
LSGNLTVGCEKAWYNMAAITGIALLAFIDGR